MQHKCPLASLLALLAVAALWPSYWWTGGMVVEIRFAVLTTEGTPIEGANVRIGAENRLESDHFPLQALTDPQGLIVIPLLCPAGGHRGFFGDSGTLRMNYAVAIEAAGYQPLSATLTNLLGGAVWSLSRRQHDVAVRLVKAP